MNGYRTFGIPLASVLDFPGKWQVSEVDGNATLLVEEPLPPWPGAVPGGWVGVSDGEKFVVSQSASGEHRFQHGDRTLFHLSADHRTLMSAPEHVHDAKWWRILLDSVLFTVSLLRGNEAIHAGAVATDAGAVAVVAGSGAGKSTLVAQLLREAHSLVTDDILFLEPTGDQILAYPGPPLVTMPRAWSAGTGTPLSDIGDERWVTVPVVPDPVPLRRLVLLERRPSDTTGIYRIDQPLMPLMTHFLKFPRTRERERTRFLLASSIAGGVEMWQLVADVKAPPEQLAALVLEGLAT